MGTRLAGRSHSLIGNSLIVSDRARPRHDNRPQLELLAAASRSARWCLCCPNVHIGAHHTLHALFLTKPPESGRRKRPISVPPRCGLAKHLSVAPLRPGEAPNLSVLPRCRPAKRFRVDPLWPGEAIQCGPAEARRSDAVLPLGAVTSGPLPGMKAAPSRFRIRKCGLAGTLAARDVGSAVLLVPRGRFRIRKWHLGRSRCRKCGVAGTSGPLSYPEMAPRPLPRSKVRPCW